jgi:hypothetical protein
MNLPTTGGYKNPIPIEADGSMLPDNSGALKRVVTPPDSDLTDPGDSGDCRLD